MDIDKLYEFACDVCGEIIIDPVCPVCLAREALQYFGEKNPLNLLRLADLKAIFVRSGEGRTSCILCGREAMICPSCFKREVRQLVGSAH